MGDIVFLRTWYPVTPPKFYNPVLSLLLPDKEVRMWCGRGEGMRKRGLKMNGEGVCHRFCPRATQTWQLTFLFTLNTASVALPTTIVLHCTPSASTRVGTACAPHGSSAWLRTSRRPTSASPAICFACITRARALSAIVILVVWGPFLASASLGRPL